jgi:hypothetical protein
LRHWKGVSLAKKTTAGLKTDGVPVFRFPVDWQAVMPPRGRRTEAAKADTKNGRFSRFFYQ